MKSFFIQLSQDPVWYSGKFWTVIFILGVILLVLILLLLRLDIRISRLEKNNENL